MFEQAETDLRISDAAYRRRLPALRAGLLSAQYEVVEQADFPVVVLVGGVDGAGKGEMVNLLNEWMDPRHVQTHAFDVYTQEERQHPRMWRYWRTLPPKGKIGIYLTSWYTYPIVDRAYRRIDKASFEHLVTQIQAFERMLHQEGALIVKFWVHLSKKAQRKRFKALEKNPLTRWRVTRDDWDHFQRYGKLRAAAERMLRCTSTEGAPWFVIDGSDANDRSLTIGAALLAAVRSRLRASVPKAHTTQMPGAIGKPDHVAVFKSTGSDREHSKQQYATALSTQQGRLNRLSRHKKFRKRGVVAVFEGPDASGKGGAIRRITAALDARCYQVVPIAAPSDEERAQPYLWRFWRRIPRLGRFTLFDRSWYGRVLVERVEGLCTESDWMRAYSEINDFEEQLVEAGLVVAKFWLAISEEEQLRRFREREDTVYKRYKITPDDWRNRRKWDAYQIAAGDMIGRTSTGIAPWTLVQADNKRSARIQVLTTLCKRIESVL